MTIYLELDDIIGLHEDIMAESSGNTAILNLGMIESAIAGPRASFFGQDAYTTVVEKAAALGYFLVSNHGFADGNKRIGHKAMVTMLLVNGFQFDAPIDEQEAVILKLAAGELDRETFTNWVRSKTVARNDPPAAKS